jgi:hypothetical protein
MSTTGMSSLVFVQQILTRYGMSTYLVFGNLGNVLTICIFSQYEQRRNPCSLYLLFMTICNLICLDVAIIPIIFSLDHQDITSRFLVACQIQFYIRHVSFQMLRTYKVLACIDRFALSSMQIHIRSFSQVKIAVRLIILSGIFWALIIIFFSFVRTIENGICDIHNDLYAWIYTIYYVLFAGILPPLLIVIFSLLLIRNLKRIRNEIRSIHGNILRKRDRDLIKMVLIEVMVYVISTIPFSIFLIYKMITNDYIKSQERKQIESFLHYITQSFLMYFNTVLPFYIYIFASTSFRRALKQIILKFYRCITRKKHKKMLSTEQQQETDIKLHLLNNENTVHKRNIIHHQII